MSSIRHAVPEDADQLTRIAFAAKRHWDYPEEWMQLWIPALTISAEYILENEVWVAVENEKLVAYYSLKNVSRIANPTYSPDPYDLWLDNLWVLPEFIGLGIGKQLFQHALERSRARGFSILKIEADPNAQSFYEKLGARQIGEHYGEVDRQTRVLPLMEITLPAHT